MTRRYISLLLIIGLMLCLFSCTLLRERVEGGISTEGLYVGMLSSDFGAYFEENGADVKRWGVGDHVCFMDEWGDMVIVRFDYVSVSGNARHVVDITTCEAKEPQQKSYLEEHLKGSSTFGDIAKVAGFPIDRIRNEAYDYFVFPVAGGEKLYVEFRIIYGTGGWGVSDFYFE